MQRKLSPLADGAPPDAEMRAAVKKLRSGRAGGGSTMRAEDLKAWLRGMAREEEAAKEGEEGHEGAGDTWPLFVRLLQHIWDTGRIPRQMLLSMVVLIRKGGNDYRGIGLLEVAWKVLDVVLDGRLKDIELHDASTASGRNGGAALG